MERNKHSYKSRDKETFMKSEDAYKQRRKQERYERLNAYADNPHMEKKNPTYKGKYEESMVDEVSRLARFGLTDVEIAEFYNLTMVTFDRYKREIPEFRNALETGRLLDSMKVVDSLHKQALGYMVNEYEESEHVLRDGSTRILKKKTTKYVLPSATAAIYLLKTRHGDKWMDVIRTEATQNLNIMVKNVDFSDMSTEELMTLKKLGIKRIPQEFSNNQPKELPQQDVRGN